MNMLEQAARMIARRHFARKRWHNPDTQAGRTEYLVDQNWRHFLPEASDVCVLVTGKTSKRMTDHQRLVHCRKISADAKRTQKA